MSKIFENIYSLLKNGENGILITVVDKKGHAPAPSGAKMLLKSNGETIGTIGGGALERAGMEQAREILKTRVPLLRRYILDEKNQAIAEDEAKRLNMYCGGETSLFFEYIGSSERVFIFGAGHIGQVLARFLKELDFHVTVCDEREEYLLKCDCDDKLKLNDYEEFFSEQAIPDKPIFVIATHSHDIDYEILKNIYKAQITTPYIGLVASKRKNQTIRGRLAEDLQENKDLSNLYSPIGLNLGGRTPADIALSITSEIQAIRHDKCDPGHMREENNKIIN